MVEYYIVLNQKITFNLGLSAAKNMYPIKKILGESSLELNFVQKSPQAHLSVSSQSGARGCGRLIWLKYYIALKWQITFRCKLVCVNAYTCV